jgi:hypothetical protein
MRSVALADAGGVAVDADRDVAGHRDAVQQARFVVVVRDGIVLGGTVVPDGDVAIAPGPADRVLQPRDLPLEQAEQVGRVNRRQAEGTAR